jgi:hypothetical protein
MYEILLLIVWQAEELANVWMKLPNKLLLGSTSCLEQCELSSNVLARTLIVKVYLGHQRDMPKLCCSLQEDTRRTCGIL